MNDNQARRYQGFAKGYNFQAAVENAIAQVGPQSQVPQSFVVVETKFSRGGIVGPATYVTLEFHDHAPSD